MNEGSLMYRLSQIAHNARQWPVALQLTRLPNAVTFLHYPSHQVAVNRHFGFALFIRLHSRHGWDRELAVRGLIFSERFYADYHIALGLTASAAAGNFGVNAAELRLQAQSGKSRG